jgi:hypothetical protein
MLNEDEQATIEECIQLLQEPSEQLGAANRLIGVCMAVRTERRPTEHVAVQSLLGRDLERMLIECLPQMTPPVHRKLAFVLGELGGWWEFEPEPAAVQALVQTSLVDGNADVRAAAVDALGKLGGPGAVRALKRTARQDPVRTVRARALFALNYLVPPPEHRVRVATPVDLFLVEMTQAHDSDTATVARELLLRRRERRRP